LNLNFDSETPIFLQIARQLEDAIFTGVYPEETQIPSTTEISVGYKINPATVLKGMNLLVEDGIVYKKRGLGMFVATGAIEQIKRKRQQQFAEKYIKPMLDEARKLGFSAEDMRRLIEEFAK